MRHSIRAGRVRRLPSPLPRIPRPDRRRRGGRTAPRAAAGDRGRAGAGPHAGVLVLLQHTSPDVALSTLVRCLDAVRRIRQHGIAEGPWDLREEWLNEQIARTWVDRGAFPGLGAALEALGMRLGTALALELIASGKAASDADPWPLVDAMLRGEEDAPSASYAADVEAVRATWAKLTPERRALAGAAVALRADAESGEAVVRAGAT